MSNLADEFDAKTLKEFWDHLDREAMLCLTYADGEEMPVEKREAMRHLSIIEFLRERAERREASYGK